MLSDQAAEILKAEWEKICSLAESGSWGIGLTSQIYSRQFTLRSTLRPRHTATFFPRFCQSWLTLHWIATACKPCGADKARSMLALSLTG